MMCVKVRRFAALCPAVAALFCCHVAVAQIARPAARSAAGSRKDDVVRIRDFDGMGAQNKVRTPTFRSNLPGPSKPAREWVRIRVRYDTYPKWIDELTFRYYALSMTREGGKHAYTSYQNTVTYVDIEKGRGHESTMFLRPPAVERFGDLVAIAVEILLEGDVIARESIAPKDFAPEWWTKTGQSGVISRPGYLLDRSLTPFTLLNPDDFEYVKR